MRDLNESKTWSGDQFGLAPLHMRHFTLTEGKSVLMHGRQLGLLGRRRDVPIRGQARSEKPTPGTHRDSDL